MAEIEAALPKKKLIELIQENLPSELIREELKIAPATTLRTRLNSFSKLSLARFFIEHSGKAKAIIRKFEEAYPIKQAPTFFVIRIAGRPKDEELRKKLISLYRSARRKAVFFGEDKTVRAVYVDAPLKSVLTKPLVYEFELAYEKRILYTCADPRSKNFRRNLVLYSFETALFWLPVVWSDHAILCCGDFRAVAPIQEYARARLGLSFFCPYLSLEMMRRVAGSAAPRTATFTAHVNSPTSQIDVKTVTISDPGLRSKSMFHTAASDPARAQTAGFYINHPDLQEAGIGVSRRYSRIWTPAILDRNGLLKLATGMIAKVDKELKRTKERDLREYIGTLRNLPVTVGKRKLTGPYRSAFESLVCAAWEAQRSSGEASVADVLPELIRDAALLMLQFRVEMECRNCGSVLSVCQHCHSPQTPRMGSDGRLHFTCQRSCPGNGQDADKLLCYCGFEEENIEPFQNLFGHPTDALLDTIKKFSSVAEIPFDRLFVISGSSLRLLKDAGGQAYPPVRFQDLNLWSTQVSIVKRMAPNYLTKKRQNLLKRYLTITKEKCFREGTPPNKVKCEKCLAVPQKPSQLAAGELCLARLFGIPIKKGFDGIHHGHEKADIIYEDRLRTMPARRTIAIHLKSRTRSRPRGLGRSVHAIKELYTQLFFLAYQVQIGEVKADVIGVSIPNQISRQVKDSMMNLCGRLGNRLLFLEEPEWLAITDAAVEAITANGRAGTLSLIKR